MEAKPEGPSCVKILQMPLKEPLNMACVALTEALQMAPAPVSAQGGTQGQWQLLQPAASGLSLRYHGRTAQHIHYWSHQDARIWDGDSEACFIRYS